MSGWHGTAREITVKNYTLEEVNTFTYLWSTVTNNLSFKAELSSHTGKLDTIIGKLTARVWNNGKLSDCTKIQLWRVLFISTPLYASEVWTPYAHRERRLNSFQLRYPRGILDIPSSPWKTTTSQHVHSFEASMLVGGSVEGRRRTNSERHYLSRTLKCKNWAPTTSI